MEREGKGRDDAALWGTFEVYVMAENDLALASLSLARSFLGMMGLRRVNFVVMLIAQKERDFLARVHCQRCCLTRSWRASLRRGSRKTHAHLSRFLFL